MVGDTAQLLSSHMYWNIFVYLSVSLRLYVNRIPKQDSIFQELEDHCLQLRVKANGYYSRYSN